MIQSGFLGRFTKSSLLQRIFWQFTSRNLGKSAHDNSKKGVNKQWQLEPGGTTSLQLNTSRQWKWAYRAVPHNHLQEEMLTSASEVAQHTSSRLLLFASSWLLPVLVLLSIVTASQSWKDADWPCHTPIGWAGLNCSFSECICKNLDLTSHQSSCCGRLIPEICVDLGKSPV